MVLIDEKILVEIAFVIKLLDNILISDWILLTIVLNVSKSDNDLKNASILDKPIFVEKNPVNVLKNVDWIGIDERIDSNWVAVAFCNCAAEVVK